MNNVQLLGRTTTKPELTATAKTNICRFTLAVNGYKEHTDFIRCIAFGKTAETIAKYINKGDMIGIDGRIHTDKYEKPETRETVFTTDIVVNNMYFTGKSSTPNDNTMG